MDLFKNKTVVIPFDFSEPAGKALDTVIESADETTKIHVVHVVEPTYSMISLDPGMAIPPTYDNERCQALSEEMKKQFADKKFERVQLHCEIGDPGFEIVHFADRLSAHLIVMPSHGRTGIARLMLGSVAERVIRQANCPVLILRGQS